MKSHFKLSIGSYKVWKFPSGELQVQLINNKNWYSENEINPNNTITGSILSSDNIMELLQLVEAMRHGVNHSLDLNLIMPYCAYSRQDRRCNPGESFSLKIFADLINSCNFSSVTTYDNHSDVSTALLTNCMNIPVVGILEEVIHCQYNQYGTKYDSFISPDAGSNKKVFECSKKFNIPMIRADKTRDLVTGQITSTQVYLQEGQLKDKTVLIIDDICAGGRTFLELAKAMKNIEPSVTIHLYVTHGFFSNELSGLIESGIDNFITTDSVCNIEHELLPIIKL